VGDGLGQTVQGGRARIEAVGNPRPPFVEHPRRSQASSSQAPQGHASREAPDSKDAGI